MVVAWTLGCRVLWNGNQFERTCRWFIYIVARVVTEVHNLFLHDEGWRRYTDMPREVRACLSEWSSRIRTTEVRCSNSHLGHWRLCTCYCRILIDGKQEKARCLPTFFAAKKRLRSSPVEVVVSKVPNAKFSALPLRKTFAAARQFGVSSPGEQSERGQLSKCGKQL